MSKVKQRDIETLLKIGCSQREISKRLQISRDAVRRYAQLLEVDFAKPTAATEVPTEEIKTYHPCPPRKERIPGVSSSWCLPYSEWIHTQLRLKRNAVAIYQDLVDKFDFKHSYSSVKRYCKQTCVREPEKFDRLEFLPGEEVQVDYGEGALTLNPTTGKYRRPRLFVMVLRYSRRAFRKVVWESSSETWVKLHEEAFRFLGGSTQYVVLDNLKEGVLKPDIYEPELNPLYASFLQYHGVVADPCRPCDPNRKGTVENGIKHTQDTALKGRRFSSIEEQNEFLVHWENNWAARRIHGSTKRQVQEMYLEERPYLKPLNLEPFKIFRQEKRTVSDDGTIHVNKSYYGAHPASLYSSVVVRIYAEELEILDPNTMEVIRRHGLSGVPGKVFLAEKERIFNPSRRTDIALRKAREIGEHTHTVCSTLFKDAGREANKRLYGILSLAKYYPHIIIEDGCKAAIERDKIHYKSVVKIIKNLGKAAGIEKGKTEHKLQNCKTIRDQKEYGEFWKKFANKTEVIIN